MRTEATSDETPDAVERAKLLRSALCAAASDADEIRATILAERARHAEEVAKLLQDNRELRQRLQQSETEADRLRGGLAGLDTEWGALARKIEADRDSLRDQLRKVEGGRDEARQLAIQWRQRAVLAEQERDCLRSLLPDVQACAEHCISCSRSGEATTEAARRILAALGSHECPERHARRKGSK